VLPKPGIVFATRVGLAVGQPSTRATSRTAARASIVLNVPILRDPVGAVNFLGHVLDDLVARSP